MPEDETPAGRKAKDGLATGSEERGIERPLAGSAEGRVSICKSRPNGGIIV